MKILLIGLLTIIFSVSSFANILEANATNDEIRDAIIASLQVRDLDCVNKVNDKKSQASELLIGDIFKENYTLSVSSDLSQPLITMEKLGGYLSNNPKMKYVFIITTDNDLKEVTKLIAKSYDNVSKVRVNVGTILDPVFKEGVRDGKPMEDFVCE
jgi:hypothetical protein